MDNQRELFPVVDEEGNVVGSINRKQAHDGTRILHPVVHLHLFNSAGELYLQQRPTWKDIQPGKWDTATGGHVDWGEDVKTALLREVGEELGVFDFEAHFLGKYVFEGKRERELVYVFTTTYDGPVHPNPDELAGGRFFSPAEIQDIMGKGILTPNFEDEYKKFFCHQPDLA